MIVHDFPSAAQPFILNQVIGLIDRGCDLTIVAKQSAHPPGDSRIPTEFRMYKLRERVIYLRPQLRPKILTLFVTALRLIAFAFNHPVKYSLAMMVAGRTRDYSALQILSRYKTISKLGRIDIIHCQFGSAGNMGLLLRAVRATPAASLITSLRGSDISSVPRRKPRLYHKLVRDGDFFLPVCNHFTEVLQSMGVPAEKIEVHYSGIDLRKFPFAAEHKQSKTAFRILAVGRLVEKKGYPVLLKALSILRSSGRFVTLTIIGRGPLRDRILKCVEDLGLRDSVTLRDWVPHDRMAREMYCHDVLATPSLKDSRGEIEGIPNVLKEAMACGLPVVCTLHSGIPDLVTDGKTGFLVPENDADALAESLVMVMDRKSMVQDMRIRARKRVEALMSMDRLNDRLLAVYYMLNEKSKGVLRV